MSVLFIYAAFNAVLILMGVRYFMQAPRITTVLCDGCGCWVEDVMHLYCEPCAMCGMVAEFNTRVPTRDEDGHLYCSYCVVDMCQDIIQEMDLYIAYITLGSRRYGLTRDTMQWAVMGGLDVDDYDRTEVQATLIYLNGVATMDVTQDVDEVIAQAYSEYYRS